MDDHVFAKAYPLALRSAQVRSAKAVASGAVLLADHEHLEQEALTRVWLALPRFDPGKAGLRTFIEVVVNRHFTSMLRSQFRRPQFACLDKGQVAASGAFCETDLRTDVSRVIAGLSDEDRRLALLLTECTPTEVGRKLRISRSTVYQGIGRIRLAFVEAGLGRDGAARSKRAAT